MLIIVQKDAWMVGRTVWFLPHLFFVKQANSWKTIALEVGLNLGPSKHRLQNSRFIHYAPSWFITWKLLLPEDWSFLPISAYTEKWKTNNLYNNSSTCQQNNSSYKIYWGRLSKGYGRSVSLQSPTDFKQLVPFK